MMVPIPEHLRARHPELGLHWYVMIGGAYNRSHARVEKHFLIGADVVVVHDGRQVRWMFDSTATAHQALGRWTGEGRPGEGTAEPEFVGVAG
jgi:hypothetical protein